MYYIMYVLGSWWFVGLFFYLTPNVGVTIATSTQCTWKLRIRTVPRTGCGWLLHVVSGDGVCFRRESGAAWGNHSQRGRKAARRRTWQVFKQAVSKVAELQLNGWQYSMLPCCRKGEYQQKLATIVNKLGAASAKVIYASVSWSNTCTITTYMYM